MIKKTGLIDRGMATDVLVENDFKKNEKTPVCENVNDFLKNEPPPPVCETLETLV